MGDLSKHFSRKEFACGDSCGHDTVDTELLEVLEMVRGKFGPVRITSGHRCRIHNKSVGGMVNSQHLRGRAADIVVKNTEPEEVADFIESIMPDHGGIGRYENFVHVDSRTNKARWRG